MLISEYWLKLLVAKRQHTHPGWTPWNCLRLLIWSNLDATGHIEKSWHRDVNLKKNTEQYVE